MRERGKRRKEERRQRVSDKEKDNEEKGRGKERRQRIPVSDKEEKDEEEGEREGEKTSARKRVT